MHSANRFAFSNPAGITVEYSRDGSTWTPYSVSDSVKVGLVSGKSNYLYIGGTSSGTTIKYKLRITLDAQRMGVYTALKKVLINVTTNGAGGAKCLIERSNIGSKTNFLTFGTFEVTGWSGWNSIPIDLNFGGDQTRNTGCLRFTFSISSLSSSYSNAFGVSDIIALGDTYWNYPSEMSKSGHLYSYDSSQNAVFPANITAKSFIGSLQGTTVGGDWVSGMTPTNATLGISTQNTISSYHPIISCKTYNSHVWNLGTITDTVGFYGFKKGRTENGTDWSFAINVTNGAVSSTGGITAPSFSGRLYGTADTANSVAWNNVSGKPSTFTPSSHSHTIANITNLQSALDRKASVSHNHDTIYAKSSHSHNTINDCNSGTSIGISSTLGIVPSTTESYDIVVTNTSQFGNKFVTMDKTIFANYLIDTIPLKAITNTQIDSLASL